MAKKKKFGNPARQAEVKAAAATRALAAQAAAVEVARERECEDGCCG